MPLDALTPKQKIFLDNYIRRHPLTAGGKRERAENFSDLRQQVLALLAQLPMTRAGKALQSRLRQADDDANVGHFDRARQQLKAVLADAKALQRSYDPTEDIAALRDQVKMLDDEAQPAIKAMVALRAGYPALLQRSVPIPAASMPTAPRGSPGWAAASQALLRQREPDLVAAEQGLAQASSDLKTAVRFITITTDSSYAIARQTALADEMLKFPLPNNLTQAVVQLRQHFFDAAYAPLHDPAGTAVFISCEAVEQLAHASLKQLSSQVAALKAQIDDLRRAPADASMTGAPARDAAAAGTVAAKARALDSRGDGPAISGHRLPAPPESPADRAARRRALVNRREVRLRQIARQQGDVEALKAEQQADEQALAALQPQPTDLSVRVPKPVEYDVAGLMAGMPAPQGDSLPGGSPDTAFEPDARALAALTQGATQQLLQQLAAQGTKPGSDAFFDLSLQAARDFAEAYAAARGWSGLQLTPGRDKVARAIGQALFERVRRLNAEQAGDDGKAKGHSIDPAKGVVTIDGQTYANPVELARGGFGKVTRYQDPNNPDRFVVVKSTVRDGGDPAANAHKSASDIEDEAHAARNAMKREIRSHKHLMNAPADAPGRANIVGMQGAMAAEDGSLHMVLELVEAGDLDDARMGLAMASAGGALPEEARNVLVQAKMKQAVQGMIYLRDQDMVHFDIKGANFMVAADGTVKVGDFGSAAVSDQADGSIMASAQRNPGTQGYVPGQASNEQVDAAYDTFALGKVMQVMHLNQHPGRPDSKLDLPPEFEQLTGALARVTQAMTSEHAEDRPRLEAVLESSYLKNLDQYAAADVDELSRLTIDYAKALKKEVAAVRAKIPAADLQRWADGKDPSTLGFTALTDSLHIAIHRAQERMATLRAELEALGPEPPAPRGNAALAQRQLQRIATHQAETARLKQAIKALLDEVKTRHEQLSAFGKSDEARAIADQMREVSQRLLRPSDSPTTADEQSLSTRSRGEVAADTRHASHRLRGLLSTLQNAIATQHRSAAAARSRAMRIKPLIDQRDFDGAHRLMDEITALLEA